MGEDWLFLSFYDINLANLPEGTFRRRRVSAAQAKAMVIAARRRKKLLCASQRALLAPYREHERSRHEELCAVLRKHYRIPLTLDDFLDRFEHEGQPTCSTKPLAIAEVRSNARLLVVTCMFALNENMRELWKTKRRLSEVAPDSVEFHLFEAVAAAKTSKKPSANQRQKAPAKRGASRPLNPKPARRKVLSLADFTEADVASLRKMKPSASAATFDHEVP
jgi:hypothetical protein